MPLSDVDERPPDRSGTTRLHLRHQAPPPPRRWRMVALTRSFNILVRDRSLDVLKANDVVAAGQVAVGAEARLWSGLVLGGEIGYAGGRSSGRVLGSFRTRLVQDSLLVGLGLGWRLWDAIMPYVRGGLAVTWLEARVSQADLSLGGPDTRIGGFVLGGIELGAPRAWFNASAFSVSLHFEAGWADLGHFRFGGSESEGNLVDESLSGLGSLRLSGAVVNTGLSLTF